MEDDNNNIRRPFQQEPESPQRNVRQNQGQPETPPEQVMRGAPDAPPPLAQRGADPLVNAQPGQLPVIPVLNNAPRINRAAGEAGQDIAENGTNIVTPDRRGNNNSFADSVNQRRDERRDNRGNEPERG